MARAAAFLIFFLTLWSGGAAAQTAKAKEARPVREERIRRAKGANVRPVPVARLVAYDAHDRRYYDLKWAKAHQMRDPAGDVLIPLPVNRLPQGANPALTPSDAPWNNLRGGLRGKPRPAPGV